MMPGMTCRMALCTATSKSANALVGVNGKFSLDMCSLSRVKNLLALSWEKCIYHRSHGTVNHDVYTIYLMKHARTGIKKCHRSRMCQQLRDRKGFLMWQKLSFCVSRCHRIGGICSLLLSLSTCHQV